MELTPIRVRGRKRARGDQMPVDPRPKPPTKRLSQKKQARPRRPKVSIIEKFMPLEILERIFWLSENVSLPRASPRLGRMLSGSSTLRGTFLAAFAPTWEIWYGRVADRDTLFPTAPSDAEGEDPVQFGGNPTFQTDLLACSWATIDMILDCRDIWVRRHAQHLSSDHVSLWGSLVTASSYTGASAAVGVGDTKEARYYFYHDYEAFRDIEQLSTHSAAVEYYTERNAETWIEVHRSIEIPDELITGPWGDKDVQKLFWLVRSGARLSPSQTWEVSREGFRNAMLTQDAPNLTVMRLLQILGAFRQWPAHVRHEEFRSIRANMLVLERDNNEALHAKYNYVGALLTNNRTEILNNAP